VEDDPKIATPINFPYLGYAASLFADIGQSRYSKRAFKKNHGDPMKYFLLLAFLPLSALADADPNFLTPADLPASAKQIFSMSGRFDMPEIPEGYGKDLAIKANLAHRSCKAPVGRQVGDWVTVREPAPYWRYSISAPFECLAPKVSTVLAGETAVQLFEHLKGVSSVTDGEKVTKRADVLCFERLEEVCQGDRLMSYNGRETCEIADQNKNGQVVVLDDLYHSNDPIRKEGALELLRDLPVWNDGRRDDSPPSVNCREHVYNKLKGIGRKSAKVSCTKDKAGAVECAVDGIIQD
jgi:hypothetical protein